MVRKASHFVFPFFLLVAGAVGVKAEQKAYSVPVSQKIVKLEVQAPDGHWIKAAVLEGDQLRIEDRDLKVAMAFIPVTKEGGVRVRVFRIEKNKNGDESMYFVENIESNLGDTAYTQKAAAAFAIRVVKVIEPPAEEEGHHPAKD